VRIWLALTKEKGSLVEILVHSKNKALPSLPFGIKVEEGEEGWSFQSTMEELIKHVATSLEIMF
jgi:C4-type Zn-finger protein